MNGNAPSELNGLDDGSFYTLLLDLFEPIFFWKTFPSEHCIFANVM